MLFKLFLIKSQPRMYKIFSILLNMIFKDRSIDNDKFIKLLASSIGYGYYYVKETKPGEVKVVPILSSQDAYDAVGKILKIETKYPGPTTKIMSLKIDTDSPTFGPSQYLVAIRNTQGKLLPLSLRISKTK